MKLSPMTKTNLFLLGIITLGAVLFWAHPAAGFGYTGAAAPGIILFIKDCFKYGYTWMFR